MTKELGSCPESQQRRNQQPEQPLHEEEEKPPKTEALDPLGYGHLVLIVLASMGTPQEITTPMIVFRKPLRLSECETAQ
jgi:hypothetical protein